MLKQWRGKLVLSQSTATALRSTQENLSSKRFRFARYGKCEQGYCIHEIPAEVTEAEADRFAAFVDAVLAMCAVRGCPAMAELDPELREHLVDAFGQHGTESMLLARIPGHVLWTDDITVSDITASEFSVRRVWTQPVLAHAANIGLVSGDDYLSAVAELLGIDYQATAFNPFVIVKAGSMADWNAAKWPFSKAMEQFAHLSVPGDQAVTFAAAMVVNLFKEALLLEMRQATLVSILERLWARKHGLIAVRVLLSLLPKLFGLNVLAADEASGIGQAWLAEARRRPRLQLP